MTAPHVATRHQPARSTAWWGMALVVSTEAALFGVLLMSYLYLRFSASPVWPPPGVEAPKLVLPAIMTAILVASSVPMQMAASASERGERRRTRVLLLTGAAMGLAFLALQAVEYHDKLRHLSPRDNSYGSSFFTITGFHGIHVIVGLLMTIWAVVAVGVERAGDRWRRTVGNVVFYWHFVDAVWIAVFSTLYLAAAW